MQKIAKMWQTNQNMKRNEEIKQRTSVEIEIPTLLVRKKFKWFGRLRKTSARKEIKKIT